MEFNQKRFAQGSKTNFHMHYNQAYATFRNILLKIKTIFIQISPFNTRDFFSNSKIKIAELKNALFNLSKIELVIPYDEYSLPSS